MLCCGGGGAASAVIAVELFPVHHIQECPAMKLLFALTALLLAGASAQASCRSEVGAAKANEYVAHCRDVSPATRPPCNADNACSLVIAEIRRGCRFLKEDAPAYCRAYLGSSR
jgi:hypothetical protein